MGISDLTLAQQVARAAIDFEHRRLPASGYSEIATGHAAAPVCFVGLGSKWGRRWQKQQLAIGDWLAHHATIPRWPVCHLQEHGRHDGEKKVRWTVATTCVVCRHCHQGPPTRRST